MCVEEAELEKPIFATIELMMCKIIARRLTGIKWYPEILLHLGVGIEIGGVLYYLSSLVPIFMWFKGEGSNLFGIVIYLAFPTFLMEFIKDDLKVVRP